MKNIDDMSYSNQTNSNLKVCYIIQFICLITLVWINRMNKLLLKKETRKKGFFFKKKFNKRG